MKKGKINEKEFKEILEVIASQAYQVEDEDMNLMKEVADVLKRYNADINDLDMFWMLDYRLDGIKKHFLHSALKLKGEAYDKAELLYLNYAFVEDVLSNIMTTHEGSPASVDKARAIAYSYLKTIMKEKVEIDHTKWNHPSVGSISEWNEVVESILFLTYGRYEQFIKSLGKVYLLYDAKKEGKN